MRHTIISSLKEKHSYRHLPDLSNPESARAQYPWWLIWNVDGKPALGWKEKGITRRHVLHLCPFESVMFGNPNEKSRIKSNLYLLLQQNRTENDSLYHKQRAQYNKDLPDSASSPQGNPRYGHLCAKTLCATQTVIRDERHELRHTIP